MRKLCCSLLTFVFLGFFASSCFASPVFAAILVINNNDQIVWNVLGDSTSQPLKIVSLPSSIENTNQQVSLEKNGNLTTLEVDSGNESKSVDVSDFADSIVEIEQPQEAKKVSISSNSDKFLLSQQNIVAQTSFPITINPAGKHVILTTPSGQRYLGIFPSDALDSLTKTGIIDKLANGSMLTLAEGEAGELEYIVDGEKSIKLFNLVNISAPLTLKISALDGQVLGKDAPVWYKIFGFLFENGGVST